MPGTIREQTVAELGGRDSVLARQRRDHAEMDRLMDRYDTVTDPGERDEVLRQLVRLVFGHAFAEETVLWPAVRRSVPDGEALTARVEEEHQEINRLTSEIERLPPGDDAREERVRQVFNLIRQDIRDEEDTLLPRLQEALDAPRLRRLGTAWESVRRTAPTHPHPAVPRRPPGNALLGVPLSGYDRFRDVLGAGTGTATTGRRAGALAALLAVVAAAAVARRRR
ncbi:hemerythrin domain-containing protein [Streptomyces sp. NPDC126503]|uniref:hemerythrin domain-containing protein n=1 Tax=Streptomyces sp. NPDC126503 TaxID=3155315 RepID=UPI003327F3D1